MRAMLGFAPAAAAALAVAWGAGRRGSRARRALMAVVCFCVFLGAQAVPWSLLMFAGVGGAATFVIVDLIAVLAIAAASFYRAQQISPAPPTPERDSRFAIAAAGVLLAVTACIAVAAFAGASAVQPHGEWDAWAQWNLRARFFFRGLGNGAWRTALDPQLAWSHADYPPLLPASVARLWTYGGRESVSAPIALAAIFASATVLTTGLSVGRTRGAARGCLAAAAILAAPSFVRWAPSQCADVVVAFFMLAAFVLWQEECHGLAGLSAGLAAWTKNEGAAFLGVFLIVAIASEFFQHRRAALPRVGRLLVGAAPAIGAIAWFKYALAPPSYYVVNQTLAQTLHRALDLGRATFIVRGLGKELWLNGGSSAKVGVVPILAAFVLVRGIDGRTAAPGRWGAVVTVLMVAVYFLAYLVTPLDVSWQVQTSVERLVLQLVPLAAWSVMSIAA